MGYSIVWEKQGALCIYNGMTSFDEMAAALTSVHQHIDFERFRYAIHDFTGASVLETGSTDLSTLIAQALGASYTNPGLKTALVAVHPQTQELARQYARRTALDSQVFSSRELARAWLQESPSPGALK